MKRKTAFPLILSIFLLAGCWGAQNIDHLFYVGVIGVDYKDDQFIVYVALTSFTGLAKVESGGAKEKSGIAVGKAKGETFNIATDNLYSSIQRMVSWAHVKSIVFTKRALKKVVLEDVLDVLDRYNEIRNTIWVYATDEPLTKLFFSSAPILHTSPYYSLLASPEESFQQSSFIRPIRLNRFVADIHEPSKTGQLPYLNIAAHNWQEDEEKKLMLNLKGMCFINDYELQKCFDRSKLLGMRWLEKEKSRVTIYVKKSNKVAASITVLHPESKISYQRNGNTPVFNIDVSISGNVIELREKLTEKQLIRLAQKTVEEEIRSLYKLGLKYNIDILNLSETLYRQNPKDWKKFSKNGKIPLTDETLKKINVKISINTSGKEKLR
ncbi:Ger(x)C family spore germination protein [Parageobacillus thermoglucosidasius]|uniref:Spore gernimation protein GerC n=3 Tax=Anoxybacillaceae TaxID=3120669 RepID=A0AAN1D7E4_PARTM|nr:Ger(x)C family spore germination protein [Parageobacillus thermoglucosidasius]ALF11001.1 spore gernimation protein GerC [Parageobacillus thermoglucosidasius]ANZ31078.1 spore gernimation protein GerC [Parageobacillus thermoglucosidasius]APM81815.1 spore gernimation protein GerC [Parageobacillus thermoglucosidasius]KJX67481.1 spore gernimation protein GerC [Parageobacillus thermoglucosidasius]MBY6267290.1 Ger(x)C family spore germination protein [Parageobacillus thermoglucosidasius]